MNKLRKIRIAIATFTLAIITLLFLDFTGTIHEYFGCLAQIQLVPAIFALNIGILIGLILLTFLFGRVYCSVICPLGSCQDVVSRIGGKVKKNRFSFSPAKNILRYILLGIFIVAFIKLGAHNIVGILDPYSAFGRIVSSFLSPIYLTANNFLATWAEQNNSYTFYQVEIWKQAKLVFILATVTLLAVSILAFRHGRTYCNTICPVGTALGFISKFSVFKHNINASKCNSCGLCAKNCKASCIDTKNKAVDYSRCVSCFNCLNSCNRNAMKYNSMVNGKRLMANPIQNSKFKIQNDASINNFEFLIFNFELNKGLQPLVDNHLPLTINHSLRSSLATVGTVIAGTTLFGTSIGSNIIKAQTSAVDGGFIELEDKIEPNRNTPIVPPGAKSVKHFHRHCTACQLCTTVCKNNVLKTREGIVPDVGFERGFCRPECVKCGEVCPTNAISKITVAEKSSLQIGFAVFIEEHCVVITDGVSCGNCERHCPVGAIDMVEVKNKDDDSYEIPTVNTEVCIGCGACEFLCPSRPHSAIYVEGVNRQRIV